MRRRRQVSLIKPLIPILIRMKLIQINENQAEIRRVAARLEHIIVALEDSKRRQVNQPQEYADALVAISQ